mgnify:CR=1 FL=1
MKNYRLLVLRSISTLLINVGNILKKHSSYSLKTLFTVINGAYRIVLNYYLFSYFRNWSDFLFNGDKTERMD